MEKVKGVGWGPHQELINDLLPMKLSFQTNVSILSLSLSLGRYLSGGEFFDKLFQNLILNLEKPETV